MSHPGPSATCRHCKKPLNPQERQLGRCGSAACRHQDGRAQWAQLSQQLGQPALDAARARPGGERATLLWLRSAQTRLVPVPARVRQAYQAHLQALVDAEPAPDERPLAPAAAPPSDAPQPGRLCAECRGHCCGLGGPSMAFLSRPQLLRWQQREGGRSLQAAADWFMAQVPARHVRHSCIYLGDQGCALPREDRADVCNSYACGTLRQLEQAVQDEPHSSFVAITLDGRRALRRVLITDAGSTRL